MSTTFPTSEWPHQEFGAPPYDPPGEQLKQEILCAARCASKAWTAGEEIDELCFKLAVFDKAYETNWFKRKERVLRASNKENTLGHWYFDLDGYIIQAYNLACDKLGTPPPASLSDIKQFCLAAFDHCFVGLHDACQRIQFPRKFNPHWLDRFHPYYHIESNYASANVPLPDDLYYYDPDRHGEPLSGAEHYRKRTYIRGRPFAEAKLCPRPSKDVEDTGDEYIREWGRKSRIRQLEELLMANGIPVPPPSLPDSPTNGHHNGIPKRKKQRLNGTA